MLLGLGVDVKQTFYFSTLDDKRFKFIFMENKIDLVSPDSIKPFIYDVRGRNVMIDSDLAALYGIETKNLKRAVRMNIVRFPTDFMFELTKEEYDFLRCNFFTR